MWTAGLLVIGAVGGLVMGLPSADDEALVERILASDGRFARLLASPGAYRLQIVLGRIVDGAEGPRLVQHGYRLDAEYFYPASTVKLLAAIAALEHLAEMRSETGLSIDRDTPLVYHPQFEQTVPVDRDPSHVAHGAITVGHEIRKLFLVSDNEAYNRLYELVGPAALDASMRRAGLASPRIVHRLSEFRTPDQHRQLPRIDFLGDGFRHTRPARADVFDPPPIPLGGLRIGRGHIADGAHVDAPLDFAAKNHVRLGDLQRALCMVLLPEVDCGGTGFRLEDDDRAFLRAAMTELPRASTDPVYDPAEYPDHWVKFMLPGLRRVRPAEHLAVANKIGRAYGQSTENAWILDRATGASFFLAATIYTNSDEVLNDDRYDYATVADPFFEDLGEVFARRLWAGGG